MAAPCISVTALRDAAALTNTIIPHPHSPFFFSNSRFRSMPGEFHLIT